MHLVRNLICNILIGNPNTTINLYDFDSSGFKRLCIVWLIYSLFSFHYLITISVN